MADIEARDESSRWIVLSEMALGHDWLEANLQEDAMRWARRFRRGAALRGSDPRRRLRGRA